MKEHIFLKFMNLLWNLAVNTSVDVYFYRHDVSNFQNYVSCDRPVVENVNGWHPSAWLCLRSCFLFFLSYSQLYTTRHFLRCRWFLRYMYNNLVICRLIALSIFAIAFYSLSFTNAQVRLRHDIHGLVANRYLVVHNVYGLQIHAIYSNLGITVIEDSNFLFFGLHRHFWWIENKNTFGVLRKWWSLQPETRY